MWVVRGTGDAISLRRRVHEDPWPPTAVSEVLHLPRTKRGRVLLVFLVLLGSYGYFFPG
jgi:hypothetical protein